MKKTAFIICTRTNSSRLPGKVFRKINGIPLIEHLIRRLQKTDLPIILSVPESQVDNFVILTGLKNVKLTSSKHYDEDPLGRMNQAAKSYGIDNIIRVTSDKIFVEQNDIFAALDMFNKKNLDYLYGSKFIPGSRFEIISRGALELASARFKNVEFIGHAVRAVTKNRAEFDPKHKFLNYRFLIDFPEDLQLMELILSQVGNGCTLKQAVNYINENPSLKSINALPRVTVYTCAYNAEKYIQRCMDSVARQRGFDKSEYILIDDFSSDSTFELMCKFAVKHPNVKVIRNERNLGLASSSNVALKNARGPYIMRLDADDYFVSVSAVNELLREIQETGNEVIIPNNYFGDINRIQVGKEAMHIGGSIFDVNAVNHIKFTDGLMGYENLDFFKRASDVLKIGYLNKPMFFYFQRPDSLSKTNLKEREKLKKQILEGSCQ